MTVNDMKQLEAELEKQELEAAGGTPAPQIYTQLLTVYLYHNDLCNAKLLWRRIPESVKAANPELASIWAIGQSMWLRNFAGVHQALAQRDTWSEAVTPIMEALKNQIRSSALALVGRAYSSLTVEVLSEFLGETPEQALASAEAQPGWKVEGGMVIPCRPPPPDGPPLSCEDQLDKLTEFVAFLEN
ncbi:hypothetical protein B566_EDAN013646 [Ephemera danica]|nr:hypothetical protein B566_EDAN013646 [Ephemera danica]